MEKGQICPVCGYEGLTFGPFVWRENMEHDRVRVTSHETCPSCGFEFGFHDYVKNMSYDAYRRDWISKGCQWWAKWEAPPRGWEPKAQLLNVGIKSEDT